MFISFEGIEGSGKGTVLASVARALDARGVPHVLTREPGGSELGKALRGLLLDARQQVAPEAELFLYLADRAQHVRDVLRPALAEKKLVLCDRYADSTIVYQGFGRGLDVERLYAFNEMAVSGLWPDLTILLDLDPRIGLERARTRNAALGLEIKEGRFEAESLAFHQRVRDGYLAWAKRQRHRFVVVDGSLAPDAVFARVCEALLPYLDPQPKVEHI